MFKERRGKICCFDTEILNANSISFYIVETEKPAIVEPGPKASVEKILRALEELGIQRGEVEFIFVTHSHLDHGGGVGDLSKLLPDAKIVCHPKAAKHLINPKKLWIASKNALGALAEVYGKPTPVPEDRIVVVDEGMQIDLGDDLMFCILTPGHAPHHASFFLQKERILFPGDSAGVFAFGKVFPTTPPPFELEDAIKSLDKMRGLKLNIIAYTHFGFAENGDLLKEIREKLMKWSGIALEANVSDVESFHSRLAEEREYREIYELIKNNPMILVFHKLTLLGLLDYARRSSSKSSSQPLF